MIDRVAKAMADNDGWGWDNAISDLGRNMWRAHARVAIAALREPTDEMAEVGFQLHTGHPCWQEDVKHAWRAMIDVALREE
jgi:hypothetical protein